MTAHIVLRFTAKIGEIWRFLSRIYFRKSAQRRPEPDHAETFRERWLAEVEAGV